MAGALRRSSSGSALSKIDNIPYSNATLSLFPTEREEEGYRSDRWLGLSSMGSSALLGSVAPSGSCVLQPSMSLTT
jgi:hypothetical protein